MTKKSLREAFQEMLSTASSSWSEVFSDRNSIKLFAGFALVFILSFLLYTLLANILPQAITKLVTSIAFLFLFIMFLACTNNNFQVLLLKIGVALSSLYHSNFLGPAFIKLTVVFITSFLLTGGYVIYISEPAFSSTFLTLAVAFLIGIYLGLGVSLDRPVTRLARWHLPTLAICNVVLPIGLFASVLVALRNLDLGIYSIGGIVVGISISGFFRLYRQLASHAREAYMIDSYDDSHIDRVGRIKFASRIQRDLAKSILLSLRSGNMARALMLSVPYKLSALTRGRKNEAYYEINCKLNDRLRRHRKAMKVARIGEDFLRKEGERSSLDLINMQALSLFKYGRIKEARLKLEEAIKKHPHHPYFWLNLALICWHMDKLDEAEDMNNRVLEIDGRCPLALRNKALFLSEKLVLEHRENEGIPSQSLSPVIRYIDMAKRVSEDRYHYVVPAIIDTLGYVELLRGNYRKAARYFLDAVLKESHNDSRLHLALLFMIGASTYLRAEYHLKKVLFDLVINKKNKIYKLALKNLENRIQEARARSIVFKKNIVFYGFLRDEDIPELAVAKTADELSEVSEFQPGELFDPNLTFLYRSTI